MTLALALIGTATRTVKRTFPHHARPHQQASA